jgi:hypothetical protein
VATGATDTHSRARFTAKTMSFITGEKYEVVVDKTEACRSQAGETTFTPMSRHVEVACRVHRCVGEVTVACRYAKAGTGHWSSALPMPDGIAFNVYHKRLGVPVAHGATRSDRHDTCVLSSSSGDAAGERGVHQSLFVGETYTIEVPATVQLQMAKKDFVVTSEGHVVSVVLARRVGRVMVHLLPGESDLPVPTSVMLQLKHRGLDQRVMPAFPVGADRAELHGEDTLLVGETYELSASANGAIIPTSTDFVVADGQVVQVQLEVFAIRIRLAQSLALHRLLAAWGEGPANGGDAGVGAPAQAGDSTWSHRFWPGQPWAQRGGDFEAAASGTTQVSGWPAPVVWSSTPAMVADVQRWVDEPGTNHGWLMLGDEPSSQNATRLASREIGDTLARPRLRVSWLLPLADAQVPLPPWALGLLGVGAAAALLRRRPAQK